MLLTWHTLAVEDFNTNIERVVAGNLETLPHDVIPRAAAETWLVSYDPIHPGITIRWQHTRHGEHVLVPLFPYLLPGNLELALATVMQLGTQAAQSAPAPVRRLHVAAGQPVCQVDLPDAGPRWRYWLGFGFMT